ncbi:MAG: SurA N-terminal domain-containing protein [Nitrospirae bacterium]|nr:SurA N-terminal domain-containing protein [Nitrospirota bacterium]
MLKLMRKHAKYFYVLFFIVILSFIFWGIGNVDRTSEKDIVAEVGKYKITTDEYWRTYENIYRFYREIYKDKFNEDMEKKMKLREKVLDSMVDEQVLLIAAKEIGIKVNNEELHEAITHEPAFMRDGIFDKNIYINRLRLNRITVGEYEKSKINELTLTKMKRLIELSVDTSDITLETQQLSSDESAMNMLKDTLLNQKREMAVKSYIEGFKKKIKIKTDIQLIS